MTAIDVNPASRLHRATAKIQPRAVWQRVWRSVRNGGQHDGAHQQTLRRGHTLTRAYSTVPKSPVQMRKVA